MPTVGKAKIVVACTSCEGQFRIGSEHDGHRIRCPKCGVAFVARAGSDKSAPAVPVSEPASKPTLSAASNGGGTKTATVPVAVGETSKSKLGDPLLGKRLKQFRLQRVVGKGGMGTVYEAEDTILKRKVALKVFRPGAAGKDPRALERFVSEARAAARLSHPNIVTIHQVGSQKDTVFIAMEMVRGGTASDFVKEYGAMDAEDATKVIAQCGQALIEAHSAGVIHHDIKPANIILGPTGTVKVTDFGLARIEDNNLNLPGKAYGTPGFISPEAIRGEATDGRSDIYSLGATFYCLLTGRTPFPGETPREVLRRQMLDAPPDPRDVAPGIPRKCAELVLKCLEPSAAKRHQSARELLEDVKRIKFGGSPSATGVDRWAQTMADLQVELSDDEMNVLQLKRDIEGDEEVEEELLEAIAASDDEQEPLPSADRKRKSDSSVTQPPRRSSESGVNPARRKSDSSAAPARRAEIEPEASIRRKSGPASRPSLPVVQPPAQPDPARARADRPPPPPGTNRKWHKAKAPAVLWAVGGTLAVTLLIALIIFIASSFNKVPEPEKPNPKPKTTKKKTDDPVDPEPAVRTKVDPEPVAKVDPEPKVDPDPKTKTKVEPEPKTKAADPNDPNAYIVNLKVDPAELTLLLDGSPAPESAKTGAARKLSLLPGKHRIEFRMEGRLPQSREVEAVPGGSTEVDIKLIRPIDVDLKVATDALPDLETRLKAALAARSAAAFQQILLPPSDDPSEAAAMGKWLEWLNSYDKCVPAVDPASLAIEGDRIVRKGKITLTLSADASPVQWVLTLATPAAVLKGDRWFYRSPEWAASIPKEYTAARTEVPALLEKLADLKSPDYAGNFIDPEPAKSMLEFLARYGENGEVKLTVRQKLVDLAVDQLRGNAVCRVETFLKSGDDADPGRTVLLRHQLSRTPSGWKLKSTAAPTQ